MTDYGPFVFVVVFLLVFGIALPLLLAKRGPDKAVIDGARRRLKALPEKPLTYKLVRCDCGAETKCPQGRNVQAGDPYRCTILKAE